MSKEKSSVSKHEQRVQQGGSVEGARRAKLIWANKADRTKESL